MSRYNSHLNSKLFVHNFPESFESSNSSMESTSSESIPFLEIKGGIDEKLRFRYKSEKGFHGGVKPCIELKNYNEDLSNIFIKATLYTENYQPHVHELNGKDCGEQNVGWQKFDKNGIARFAPLYIITKKKDEINEIIKKNILGNRCTQENMRELDNKIKEKIRLINLNSAKLCFQAFKNKEVPLTEKIFSNSIINFKKTNSELTITRLSHSSGKSSGNEGMILLCEKVNKEDVEIYFYQKDADDKVIWEKPAMFSPADVHHQVAIFFRTPRFQPTSDEYEVKIELRNKKNGQRGESRDFTVIPDESIGERKRKRSDGSSDSLSSMFCDSSKIDFSDLFGLLAEPEETGENSPLFPDICNVLEEKIQVMEAAIELTSLSISNNRENQFRVMIQELKKGIFSILGNLKSYSFLKVLPSLLSLKDDNSNTILNFAVLEKSEDLSLLKNLLQYAPKFLINQGNSSKMTILHYAIIKGLTKVIPILLHFGANPNVKNATGNNSLHLAAMNNLPECLNELFRYSNLKKETMSINAFNYEGLAPLHLAIINESYECVKILINNKALINIRDCNSGKTPLHFAYEQKSSLVDHLLSDPNIDQNVVDFKGQTPFHTANDLCEWSDSINSKSAHFCIEMSECDTSVESNGEENNEVANISNKLQNITEEKEKKMIEILNSSGLWRRMGLYIMDEKKLSCIEALDTNPTETILKELKKKHQAKYFEKLADIFTDVELKSVAEQLEIS